MPPAGSAGRRYLIVAVATLVVTTLAAGVVSLTAVTGGQSSAARTPPQGGRESTAQAFQWQVPKPGAVPVAEEATGRRTEVPKPRKRRDRTAFVAAGRSLPAAAVLAVRRLDGVKSAEVVDAARIDVGGETVSMMGVDPTRFREYAPRPAAKAGKVWQSLADGGVAVSYEMGKDAKLPLGKPARANGVRPLDLTVGAYATSGIPGIDALVSRTVASELGLPRGNALVIDADGADPVKLREGLEDALPKGAGVQVLTGTLDTFDGSGALSASRIEVALKAAQTRLGTPYVWGAEGPNSFDCSGLVQWAFAKAGVRMPRVAADQARTGPTVPYSEARPGDLLSWRLDPTAPDYISHIAIYLGDGKMIVAPRTGDVVKIAAVPSNNTLLVTRIRPAG